jgi:uncharacterized protein
MRGLFFFILIFFFKNILFAQAPNSDENALLWKITGRGLRTPAYLYGTIHIIPKKDFFITDSTLAALNQADNVAFEFNLKKEMRLLPQMRLMLKMKMRNDTTLSMLLDEADYEIVRQAVEKKRLPMRLVERVKPMFITDIIAQDFAVNKDAMTSYEMEFLERAKQQGKKISGLETARYQIGVFDKIPYGIQAQMLVEELKKDDKSDKEYKRLVRLYKRQDLEMLGKMVIGDENAENGFNDVLLDTRNLNWIPVMEKLMQKNKMFFAVGAAHLIGEKGVVALLRRQGYTLTAIK